MANGDEASDLWRLGSPDDYVVNDGRGRKKSAEGTMAVGESLGATANQTEVSLFSVVNAPAVLTGRDRLHTNFRTTGTGSHEEFQSLTRPAHHSDPFRHQRVDANANITSNNYYHPSSSEDHREPILEYTSPPIRSSLDQNIPANNNYNIQGENTESIRDSTISARTESYPNTNFNNPRTNGNEFLNTSNDQYSTTNSYAQNISAFNAAASQQSVANSTLLGTSSQETTISSTHHLSGGTMGYSDVNHFTWSVQDTSSEKMERSEGKSRDSDESTANSGGVVGSPNMATMIIPEIEHDRAGSTDASTSGHGSSVLGTPSTVSTEPSTDEASVGGDSLEKIGLKIKMDTNRVEQFTLHRRELSWDTSPRQCHFLEGEISSAASFVPNLPMTAAHPLSGDGQTNAQYWLPQHMPASNMVPRVSPTVWGSTHSVQQRTATFRNIGVPESKNDTMLRYYPSAPTNGDRWPQHRFTPDPQPPYITKQGFTGGFRPSQGFNPYQIQRKATFSPPMMQSNPSPTRSMRPQRNQGPSPHRLQQQSQGGNTSTTPQANPSRSSSEILKTLLRKKACLYEPDTSRAVALVTWLVGRVLALEYGFFSRQQLQAGVHACVAEKINSGAITRTKVNRCMQIILNSCFHYIIPRPDGTEEKGASFRNIFKEEVGDDASLLRLLPAPWNDLLVDKKIVIAASSVEDGKQDSGVTSPGLKSAPSSPISGKDSNDVEGSDVKRAVLLCFNENVRAAEDVFRCHNEFIRDSAHSSNLQLSAQEWRTFFGKEVASTLGIWGNVGIPIVATENTIGTKKKPDVLGRMTKNEVAKFRTTWCAKRYDHDHELCGFAHVNVNRGWLRRNFNICRYKDEHCPLVTEIAEKRICSDVFVINECPKGIDCEYAHSLEEVSYHPNQYKNKICSQVARGGICEQGDICPNYHQNESLRQNKKPEGRIQNSRHVRLGQLSSSTEKNALVTPSGSPILYASPAPVSSFEKQLLMPGLQSLFRRHCSVVRAHLRNPEKCVCSYSHFFDDKKADEKISSQSCSRGFSSQPCARGS